MADEFLFVAWKEVDDGYLYHGVGSRLLLQGGTRYVDKHLCGESGVVDAHVEDEVLVVGGAADSFADKVDAVAYVVEGINTGHLLHVGLVVHEVGV